jgi:hypothetical protein
MKIRFFSQTRIILSFVPAGTGGKIAEVGGKRFFHMLIYYFRTSLINIINKAD